MKIVANNNDLSKNNVIYKVTCYVGNHYKEYHYIRLTKRKLEKRIFEHLTRSDSAVYNFIKKNNVKQIYVEILRECKYEQFLDSAETAEIANYILHRGTRNNQRNRLINIDHKGLDTYTLNTIQDIYNKLQFN